MRKGESMELTGLNELFQNLWEQIRVLGGDLYNLAKTILTIKIQFRIIGIAVAIVVIVPIFLWCARPVIGRRGKRKGGDRTRGKTAKR